MKAFDSMMTILLTPRVKPVNYIEAANRKRVLAIYDEYRRRGITKFKTPNL
jgi:hypothetical protein